MSQKCCGSDLHFSNALTSEKGLYGYYWAKKLKGDQLALPSMLEGIDGLYEFYCEMVFEKCKGMDKQTLKTYLKETKKTFEFFYSFFDGEKLKKPLTQDVL